MTKPLSKIEKAHRVKVRKLGKDIAKKATSAKVKKPGRALATAQAHARSVEEELVRCNEELSREKDKLEAVDRLYKVSCDEVGRLRAQGEKLRSCVTGLELRVEEQRGTIRAEQYEIGLLCRRLVAVARRLGSQHGVLTEAVLQHYDPERKPRKPTIPNWAEWIAEQAEILMAARDQARGWDEDVHVDRVMLVRSRLGGVRELRAHSLDSSSLDEDVVNTFGPASTGDTVEKPEYKTKIMVEKKARARGRKAA